MVAQALRFLHEDDGGTLVCEVCYGSIMLPLEGREGQARRECRDLRQASQAKFRRLRLSIALNAPPAFPVFNVAQPATLAKRAGTQSVFVATRAWLSSHSFDGKSIWCPDNLQSTQPGKPRWRTPPSSAFCSTCFTLCTFKSY